MSRIGKKSIVLSEKINTKLINNIITIEGPKGKLSHEIPDLIIVNVKTTNNCNILMVTTKNQTKQAQQLHGLSRTLINNMVVGVSEGFSKKLEIKGVGYRSQMDGRKLVLNVGYSHPVIIEPPDEILITVQGNTNVEVTGINKAIVGQLAAKIRSIRPPEPYKGKGIRYKDETVKKKIGKAGK
uniref:ribosomal protein L6 n=1 Tax=Rhodochorton tenue TaxID=173034 RepID=UPI002A833C03|nr:ribosomal protein L6 [Rhodochorton tenue]WOK79454.1 ribosomal protein L6 [Rhodochorton tenue]